MKRTIFIFDVPAGDNPGTGGRVDEMIAKARKIWKDDELTFEVSHGVSGQGKFFCKEDNVINPQTEEEATGFPKISAKIYS